MSSPQRDDEPFAYFDPMVLTGQWADRTRVHRGAGEFTIDFLRLIPSPEDRALVARAIVAPWRDGSSRSTRSRVARLL